MAALFHAIVYDPVYNAIVFFSNLLPGADFGIGIIGATILIKLLFLSLSRRQIESQKKMQEIQPKVKEIQQKYKDDKEKQAKAMMEFYRENKINPFSGCLPLIVQIVFLIAIYRVIISISQAGFAVDGAILYPFIKNPGELSHMLFGTVDLSIPSKIFAIVAAVAQFYQMKMLQRGIPQPSPKKKSEEEPDFATIMNKQMLYIGPILTLWIGFTFPAGLSLYWLVSTVFAIFQQWYILSRKQERPTAA